MSNETEIDDECDAVKRSFAECVAKGMNPNPNAPGEIPPMSDSDIGNWAGSIFNRLQTA